MEHKRIPSDGELARYKLWTWTVFTFWVTVGTILGVGFGGLMVYHFLSRMYLPKRDEGYRQLQFLRGEGLDAELERTLDDFKTYYEDYRWKQIINDSFTLNQCMLEDLIICRTCNEAYRPYYVENLKECHCLRDVFPHHPNDVPPTPNPFEHYWLQFNGYRKPPLDWPLDSPWLPITAIQGPAEMLAEGRKYYSKNANTLWDAGFGKVPDWYRELNRGI